jgi:putative transposase
MKKSQFTESRMLAVLKEGEAGVPVAQIMRKHGISQATYYNWKSKYGGASVAELKRLKELEAENATLKRMYADLALENATSIPALRLLRFLEQLIEIHGKPAAIRCDNGPELTSYAFTEWCKTNHIKLMFIQPGKPDQNAFIERFNRTYRSEVLNAYLFDSISQVREITDDWLRRYNEIRPHDALGSLPPARYRERLLVMDNSTLQLST